MNKIHSTAIIGENCIIGKNVTIGAYSVIEENVKIGDDNIIYPSVYIGSNTEIGKNNKFFPYSSIGSIPQDLKYRGEKSKLIIGNNNIFREHCTANLGTEGDNLETVIGDSSLFMVGTHIAHDCVIGNNVIFANQATLGGHVIVDDYAVIGGISAVHQFCKIGKLAMIGGMSAVENDVIPYGLAIGNRAKINGINIIGLKRAKYSKDDIREYSNIVEKIFNSHSISKEKNKYKSSKNPLVTELLLFLDKDSSRGLCKYDKK
tara:strand:+ start:383 stop:1165 length:783 start_codon:yes stop_codon:yes gene_type:complete